MGTMTTYAYDQTQIRTTENHILREAADAGWRRHGARASYSSARQSLYRARGSDGEQRFEALLSFASSRAHARMLRRMAAESEEIARQYIRSLSERW